MKKSRLKMIKKNSTNCVFSKKHNYYATFLLSTDFEKLGKGEYKLLTEDKSGPLDRGFRLRAAELLYRQQKTKHIIIVGGKNKVWKEWRPDIIELNLRGKIPNYVLKKLYCEPGNTCGNAKSIIEYIVDKKLWEKEDFIGILTNKYHLNRIISLLKYMLDKKEYKKVTKKEKRKIKRKLIKIPAEDVILTWEKKDKKIKETEINSFYNQVLMKIRKENEKKGLQDIKNDEYKCKWD